MDRWGGKNVSAKIFALILAAILWMYVMNEQNPPVESTVTIPLELRNLSGKVIVVDAPEEVRVKVRGPRNSVAGLLPKDIKSYLELKGLPEGRHTVKVNPVIPLSLELVEVTPDKVQIRLDSAASRQLPVEIKIIGATPVGILVDKVSADPMKVTVEGPRSQLDAVEKVVANIDMTEKRSTFTVSAPLMALTKDGRELDGLGVSPEKSSVTVVLVQGSAKKLVDVKPIAYSELPPGIVLKRIITEPDKVEISGNPQALAKTDSIYTAPINLAGINKDTTMEVKLQPKEGISSLQGTVKVHITIGPKF